MTMSVKMLNDIAVHAEGLASEAVAMAEALRAVVDDCAAQVAANRSPDNPAGKPDPEWLEGKILDNADLCVLLPEEETLVTLYRDDLYMTVYNACGSVLKRLEQLAEAEELFVR